MKISVLINNYNYARFLPACIDSALSQDYPDFEVVIVDDGSTDNSRDIIAAYGDRLVPVLKKNGGQASCFNAGFAAAKGDILCLLDADDAFLPGKLAQVAKLYRDMNVDWVFDRVTIDENTPPPATISFTPVDKREVMRKGGFPSLPVPTSGLTFHRRILSEILPMATMDDVVLSDNYLKFAAAYLGQGVVIDTPLTFQRIHGANRYTNSDKARQLRSRIMIATGLELTKRYNGMRSMGRALTAGGLAESALGPGDLLVEARRCARSGGYSLLPFTALVILKRFAAQRHST